jgi:predicted nucleotidyltransferase
MEVGGVTVDRKALEECCRHHRIRQLSLFGSVLSGTDRADSDIDLLVEFESGKTPGLLRLGQIEGELSALLGGRRVDLRTAQDLSRHFREQVVRLAEVQYGAGGLDAPSARGGSR